MKINLGCGPHGMQGWINLDLDPPNQSLYRKADLSQGLPPVFERESVDFIYSEHFIEHITREQALKLMKDCFRVMKPGGVMRISTPDLDFLITCYRQEKLDKWAPTWQPKTPCQMVNEGMRLWSHQFLYDKAELMRLGFEAGFVRCKDFLWRVSERQELRGLEVRPNCGDLILEFYKY
jgi:predicted SAM-dependent methyltransferase